MKKIALLGAIAAIGVAGTLVVTNTVSAKGFGQGRGLNNGINSQNSATMKGRGLYRGNQLQFAAQSLGLSQEDLQAQLNSGKTLNTILQEKGMTLDQFHQKMEEQMKAYLQTLVSQGQITQAQADQRIQFMEQRQDNCTGTNFGMGRMGRFQ